MVESGRDISIRSSRTKRGNESYVYVRCKNHAWVPAIQIKTFRERSNNGGEKVKATVIRPIFQTEQDMLQCCATTKSRSPLKYSKEETVDLSDYPNALLPLQNVDADGNLQEYCDMVSLPFMHEAALLYNLKKRHIVEKPYTRTGDILIAVNPYKWFPDLYSAEQHLYYSNRLVWDHSITTAAEDPRLSVEPHVYEVSALAYKGLTTMDDPNQSILVSGESGAGKTETVKICLNHIASTQRGPNASSSSNNDNHLEDPVVQRIVDSNPLLEAFGNAQTSRNDNSSRFGKYLQLQFDRTSSRGSSLDMGNRSRHCALVGSKCEVYLLEKNRVVQHQASERNFHIFYQLLRSSQKAKFWSKLQDRTIDSFNYLGVSKDNPSFVRGSSQYSEAEDAANFEGTLRALSLVHIHDEMLLTLMQAVCVVLQLGNLGFAAHPHNDDGSVVSTPQELADLAELMNMTEQDLIHAFTQRTFITHNETHKVPLNVASAKEACDALAKEIYQKIFLWLVQKVNQATAVDDSDNDKRDIGVIGMLDIFGFEMFKVNRFEQLCINYANEKLQQKFTQDIFCCVQQEYHDEGIPIKEIYYDDNSDVLDLIEGRPTGLLSLLNEECVRPGGSAREFVHKALTSHRGSRCLQSHPMDRMSFGIQHYAGRVMYDSDGFIQRNQDTLPTDLQECAEKCSNDIIRAPRSEPAPYKNTSAKGVIHRGPSRAVKKQSNLVAPTVWTKYKNQLRNLMNLLNETKSRYIRCIKPNNQKAPRLMEHQPVIEQLRCAGVVAGITITRSVFPNSLENSVVLARYSSLGGKNLPHAPLHGMKERADACHALLSSALFSKRILHKETGEMLDAFVVGKTKTYFRAGALEWLEMNRLSNLDVHAILIQRNVRGWLTRAGNNSPNRLRLEQERAEQEERERRELEEKERLARRERQRLRRMEQESELDALRSRIAELQEAMEESDRVTTETLATLKTKRRQLRHETQEWEEKLVAAKHNNEAKQNKILLAQQKQKFESNKKLVDYLRHEGKKYKKDYKKTQEKWASLKEINVMLKKKASMVCYSSDQLNMDTMVVCESMDHINELFELARSENKKLKNKLFKAQELYSIQSAIRLEYQKGMKRIIKLLQKKVSRRFYQKDEAAGDALLLAHKCERVAVKIIEAVEDELEPSMSMTETSECSESYDISAY